MELDILKLKYHMNMGRYAKIQNDYKEKKAMQNLTVTESKTFDNLIIENLMQDIDFCIYFLFNSQEDIEELEEFYKLAYKLDRKCFELLKAQALTTFMVFYNPEGFVKALKEEAKAQKKVQ